MKKEQSSPENVFPLCLPLLLPIYGRRMPTIPNKLEMEAINQEESHWTLEIRKFEPIRLSIFLSSVTLRQSRGIKREIQNAPQRDTI